MDLKQFPKQYQLLHTLAKHLFIKGDFKCAVLISKTPYLAALTACHGSRIEILPPYEPDTCLLLPYEENSNRYVHAVIQNTEDIKGQEYYWYIFRKQRSNSDFVPVKYAKPKSYIEKYGKIFPHQSPQNWLGRQDILLDEVYNLTNSIYPVLIGHDIKSKINYWKKVPLGMKNMPKLTMESILGLSFSSSKLAEIKTYSPKNIICKKYQNQIWINDVPECIDNGRFLILISPTHNRFQDLIYQVNDLYANNRLTFINENQIPSQLKMMGIKNRALSVIALMGEPVK